MQIPRDVLTVSDPTQTLAGAAAVTTTVAQHATGQTHPQEKAPSQDAVLASVDNVKKHLQNMKETNVELSFDKELNRVIVKYVNPSNLEVESQIPSEKFVEFAKEFTKTIGLLFDKKV